MNLQTGDRVRYLNAKGGGVVSKILSNGMVQVCDESGFDIPFQKNELVKVDADFSTTNMIPKRKDPKKEAPAPPPAPVVVAKSLVPDDEEDVEGNDMPRVYLGVVPQDDKLFKFDIFLINDCNYHLLYTFSSKKKKMLEVVDINTLEANTKQLVTTVTKDSLQDIQGFVVQGTFFKKKLHNLQQALQKEINISAVKFYKDGCFKENDFFDENAMIELVYERTMADEVKALDGKVFERVIFQKEIQDKKLPEPSKKENKDAKNIVKEVDLHIHNLVENEAGMTPGDKLNTQLQVFEKELNTAIVENIKKIVFIHGVGNGVLKLKIANILDRKYPKMKYQDASFQKYKFGATMVII